MKIKINEKGQALIMVLFFSVISMLMIAAILYMVLRGTNMSGIQKRYQTALDAGYAGVGTTTAFLDSGLYYQITSSSTNPVYVPADGNANTAISGGTLTITSTANTCFYNKLFTALDVTTNTWGAPCLASDATIDPTVRPDIEYAVAGRSGAAANTPCTGPACYYVYAKVVDSRRGITAQRPPGGLEVARGFSNRTLGQGLVIQPQAYFYYTVEVMAQETRNDGTTRKTKETSQISFDYAY